MYSLWKRLGQYLTFIVAGLMAAIFSMVIINITPKLKPIEGYITFISALVILIASVVIASQVIRGSPKFIWIRERAFFGAATGGISFYEADLTDACFDGLDLSHTDFRKAYLIRTSFKGATGLELARLQGTILEDPKARKLLITNDGRGQDFTEADLSGANLQGADLREAILVKAQLLDADLSEALLTDACIQDWNINHNTCFENVDCQRIYLKRSLHGHFFEPKPDSGEFQPGEFEKWITDVRDTIDLIFQNGLNWRAFAFSLAQTALNNDGIDLAVRSIENKGDGVVVAKISVSLDTNKATLHEEITHHYQEAVRAIETKYELVLQAKDGEIQRLKDFYNSQQQFIQGLISAITETKQEVIIQGEGNRLYMINQAGDIIESSNQSTSKTDSTYNLNHAKFGGGFAGTAGSTSEGTFYDYSSSHDLSDTAAQIQRLLQQLEQSNATATETEKMIVAAKAADEIKDNPTLKARVIGALMSGGKEAFKEAVDNPLVNVLVAIIEGWLEGR